MKGKSFRIVLTSVVSNAVHSQYPHDHKPRCLVLSSLRQTLKAFGTRFFLLDSSDALFGTKNRIFGKKGCLVFKPHFCARPMRLGSRGPSESDTSPKCIDREGLWRRRTRTNQAKKVKLHLGQSIAFPVILKYIYKKAIYVVNRGSWL